MSQGSEGSGATAEEGGGMSRSSSSYVRGGGGSGGGGSVASGVEGNRALYVGNLAPSVDEHVLVTQFSMYGQVISAQVSSDCGLRWLDVIGRLFVCSWHC
jgi:hypothetical protein